MLLTKLPKTNFDFLIYHEKNKTDEITLTGHHKLTFIAYCTFGVFENNLSINALIVGIS